MKKILISVSAAIALIGAAAVSHAVIERNNDSLLEQNVEALMDPEIIVGPLCMACPNAACTTLGEVLLEHYPA